jgi:hypothetical protein
VPTLEIACLAAILAAAGFWLNGLKARDVAVSAARKACESEGLQFLDDTVSLSSLRPIRNDEGALALRRVYTFEFSDTGDNRRPGSVVLLGHQVFMLNVGPRPVPEGRALH